MTSEGKSLNIEQAAQLIVDIKRHAEEVRAWASPAGVWAHRIADRLHQLATAIECDVREEISKNLINAQSIYAVADRLIPGGEPAAERLETSVKLDDVPCFAVGPHETIQRRAAELDRAAEMIQQSANLAQFVLYSSIGPRRRSELGTAAREVRELAASLSSRE